MTCEVAGDPASIPGLGRSSGVEYYPLQYSGLENSMDNSPWGHKKSDTTDRLSLHFARATQNLYCDDAHGISPKGEIYNEMKLEELIF